MKRMRGSNQEGSKIPRLKNKSKKKRQPETDDSASPPAEDNHDRTKSSKKTKASETAPAVKGSENLRQIRRSSIIAMENVMNVAILTTLGLRRTKKKESHDHLNIVKNRFLKNCAELQVPMQKQEELKQSWQRHQEESDKRVAVKQTLTSLEEDLKAVLKTLESTEEQTSSLQRACSSLREQLEEEEEKAQEMLQRSKQAVLGLPSYPPR